ncbi:MFS transporter [Sulfobacillus thermosulfidooxidans]|uniref:MFS transporter n=1 Tax=Sulfobacillus thermosulfidooxidans TaxID=28034 RepID=UPI0006B50AC0|nr:MFS transporter [Sulfobacillus thermosulfidooxidans]
MKLFAHNRRWMLLMTGQFVSSVGNNFYTLAIYWYVLTITHSRVDVLWIGLAQTLPAVGSLFWGGLIDRFDRRFLIIVSDLGRFVLGSLLFWLTSSIERPSIGILFVVVFVLKSLGTIFGPSLMAFIPTLISSDQLPSATGIFKAISGLASLVGVAMGGILMALYGPSTLFGIDALTFLVSLASLLLIRTSGPIRTTNTDVPLWSAWKTGIRVLWRSLWIRRFVLVAMMANLVLVPLEMVLPQWVHGPLKGTPMTLGWLNTAFLVGFIVGAVMVGWAQRWPTARVLGWAFAGMGALVVLFGQVTAIPLPYAIAAGIGTTIGLVESLVTSSLLAAIPEKVRGRAFSSYSGILNLMTPVGMGLTELIIGWLGIAALFAGAGSMVLLLSLMFLIPAQPPTSEAMMAAVGDPRERSTPTYNN